MSFELNTTQNLSLTTQSTLSLFSLFLNKKRMQEKANQAIAFNTKATIVAMGLLFILLQIGFHPTYLQYFPKFEQFNWLHHTHGAIMVSWMVMLVLQPYLIHKRKYSVHRLIGKISYITAPLMLISMFLVTRLNYLTTVGKLDFKDVAHIQALNFIEPLSFFIFYLYKQTINEYT